jgi:hypothetical protein
MTPLLAFLAGLPLMAAAPECRTPYNNAPCFTLRYSQSMWAFMKSPVREFVKTEHKGLLAVRADGSMVSQTEQPDRFALRDRRQHSGPTTTLYLAEGNRLVHDNQGSFDDYRHVPPLVWNDRPSRRTPEGDTRCAAVARGFGVAMSADGTGRLLGQAVTKWKHTAPLIEVTLALAPGLDCQALSYSRIEYRYKWVPVRHELFEATSVTIGDPDAALFAVPKRK